MRSRSTSQYVSAETKSRSGCSPWTEPLLSIVFRPESLGGFSSLRLAFARRQRSRRRRRIAPITIFSLLYRLAL
jgi:hypothetical protein